jgi:GH25 family lysozyme M1 (1,4-beta-N-acetylmuramidase)
MIIGVDYASVDGNLPPDWGALKNACTRAGNSLGFAIFRGAYGTMLDSTIARDMNSAQAAGLITGAYLFLRMTQSPTDQVRRFADNVGRLGAGKNFPPIVDVEEAGVPATEVMNILHAAWNEMASQYQVTPIVYFSDRVVREVLGNLPPGALKRSPLWLAKPWPWQPRTPAHLTLDEPTYRPKVPSVWGDPGNWWMHQYQGDAYPCPGFTNTVDLSRFNVMRLGEFGDRVRWVQEQLNVTVTRAFGVETVGALKQYQAEHGLVPDGVLGPKTFAALAWEV